MNKKSRVLIASSRSNSILTETLAISLAEESFKEAAEAYSILSDQEKRAQYDRFGHASVGGAGFGGFDPDTFSDFSDILGDFFGFGDIFGSSRRSRNHPQRGADLRYDLGIEFEEAVFWKDS